MADDVRQTIESYVATALKQRFSDAGGAVGAAREKLLAAFGALEQALGSAGDARFDLPPEMIPAPPPPPPPPASEVGLVSHILSAQKEVLAAADQVGLLTQLLLGCTVSCPRVAFFILKKDALAGWAARGFERAQDADVRSLSVAIADNTILGAAFRSGNTVRSRKGSYPQDRQFLSRLGGDAPAEAMAVPIWIRDKVAAVLYGDSGRDEQILDPEVPEVLGLHAGLCLETLATRQKFPRQKAGEASAQAAPPAPSGPQAGALSPPGPIAVMAGSGSLSAASTAAPVAAPEATPAASLSSSGPQIAIVPAPPPTPPAAATPAPAPSRPAMAPAPSLDGMPEDERKLHEEARRFARLLVSEIVLYNERQVEEGRRQKDLYERLKEDIDRSKGMFDQRVNPKVRTSANYFYIELVRTLANGDESAIKVPWA